LYKNKNVGRKKRGGKNLGLNRKKDKINDEEERE